MKTKLWLTSGVLVCGLIAWGILHALTSGAAVEAARATRGSIRTYVDERAKTRLPNTYLITMPFPGRIEPITVTEGMPVSQGYPVARILQEDLDLALEEARAGFGQAEAAVAENADVGVEQIVLDQTLKIVESMKTASAASAARVEAALAGLKYANSDLERVGELRKTNAQTENDLERAILRQAQCDAEYRQAVEMHKTMQWFEIATGLMPGMVQQYMQRKGLTGAVLERQKARAEAQRQRAELDYRRGTMTSPVDGVVLARHVTNERVLPAGTVLVEIGQLEKLEVEADVLTQDVADVREGQPVEIYGPAIGKEAARGTVHRVYPAGFTKISSLGVEQQRVNVVIRFEPAELKRLLVERSLRVGYRIGVRIVTSRKDNALLIPRSALFRSSDGQWQVYAIRDGRARIRNVRIGLINDHWAEILEGVAEGEQVVQSPESTLVDGARVNAAK
ncbi:MAG TPA: efflux RND transporter periplasmic adaptor subunit [Thermoguttaceae bacterium]|nr:efflux RND transporter periplasmic adaptor subunit [Thermoguttaceae bacterium]